MSHLLLFIDLCRAIGSNNFDVQGNGGNISFKEKKNALWIKSSGASLENVSLSEGISSINYSSVDEYEVSSNKWNEVIEQPSIELAFHIRIPYFWVIHTHSLYFLPFLCDDEGIRILKELFLESIVIPYLKPGKEIADFMTLEQTSKTTSMGTALFFLKNHGIIFAGNHIKTVTTQYEKIKKKIYNTYLVETSFSLLADKYPLTAAETYFESGTPYINKNKTIIKRLLEQEQYLTPDQALYLDSSLIEIKDTVIIYKSTNEKLCLFLEELLKHYIFIIIFLKKKKRIPHFLSKEEVEDLRSREDEKKRKMIISEG